MTAAWGSFFADPRRAYAAASGGGGGGHSPRGAATLDFLYRRSTFCGFRLFLCVGMLGGPHLQRCCVLVSNAVVIVIVGFEVGLTPLEGREVAAYASCPEQLLLAAAPCPPLAAPAILGQQQLLLAAALFPPLAAPAILGKQLLLAAAPCPLPAAPTVLGLQLLLAAPCPPLAAPAVLGQQLLLLFLCMTPTCKAD